MENKLPQLYLNYVRCQVLEASNNSSECTEYVASMFKISLSFLEPGTQGKIDAESEYFWLLVDSHLPGEMIPLTRGFVIRPQPHTNASLKYTVHLRGKITTLSSLLNISLRGLFRSSP